MKINEYKESERHLQGQGEIAPFVLSTSVATLRNRRIPPA